MGLTHGTPSNLEGTTMQRGRGVGTAHHVDAFSKPAGMASHAPGNVGHCSALCCCCTNGHPTFCGNGRHKPSTPITPSLRVRESMSSTQEVSGIRIGTHGHPHQKPMRTDPESLEFRLAGPWHPGVPWHEGHARQP